MWAAWQTHLHSTNHHKNTAITKTSHAWLLTHANARHASSSTSLRSYSLVYPTVLEVRDCNACHDLWNNTLFCLAEQNIWPYFLAYRQIINNSHLIPPKLLPLLPSLPLFLSSLSLHFPIYLYFSLFLPSDIILPLSSVWSTALPDAPCLLFMLRRTS